MPAKLITNLFTIFFLCSSVFANFVPQPATAQPQLEPLVITQTQSGVAETISDLKSGIQPNTSPELDLASKMTIENPTEISVPMAQGLIITPTRVTSQGYPGTEVVYIMAVGNRGPDADTFDIEMTSVWDTTISADEIGPLLPGENAELVLTVTVPSDAQIGEFDTAQVTATSQTDPERSADAWRTTYTGWDAVSIEPAEATAYGNAGETITYNFTITNIGYMTDTYTVTVNTLWDALYPPKVGPLAEGESTTLPIEVIIPSTAIGGESDLATLKLNSPLPGAMDAEATMNTMVRSDYGMQVSVEEDTFVVRQPSIIVTYTMQLTNLGILTDTYTVNITSTWNSDYAMPIATLAPEESTQVIVMITVPADVGNGDTNLATVRFTSQGAPTLYREVVLTTKVIWFELFLPLTMKN